MFERLISCFFPGRLRRQRQELTDRLFSLLERRGAIVFNDGTVEWLGRGQREALLLVCYLAVRERIHLTTDHEGRMLILSNEEYVRRIRRPSRLALSAPAAPAGNFLVARRRRSTTRARLSGSRIMQVDMAADCLPVDGAPGDAAKSVVTMRPSVIEDGGVEGKEHELDSSEWFKVVVSSDVLAPAGGETELPDSRQALPDRQREPWSTAERWEK